MYIHTILRLRRRMIDGNHISFFYGRDIAILAVIHRTVFQYFGFVIRFPMKGILIPAIFSIHGRRSLRNNNPLIIQQSVCQLLNCLLLQSTGDACLTEPIFQQCCRVVTLALLNPHTRGKLILCNHDLNWFLIVLFLKICHSQTPPSPYKICLTLLRPVVLQAAIWAFYHFVKRTQYALMCILPPLLILA